MQHRGLLTFSRPTAAKPEEDMADFCNHFNAFAVSALDEKPKQKEGTTPMWILVTTPGNNNKGTKNIDVRAKAHQTLASNASMHQRLRDHYRSTSPM